MQTTVTNRVGSIRRSRGIPAATLARSVGVSRQTIYAIEAGTYVPNTEVSLKLARELEVKVDELFSLAGETVAAPAPLRAEVLAASPPARGQAVRVAKVGGHLVAVPVNAAPCFLPDADGVVEKPPARLLLSPGEADIRESLVLAGCDPAVGLLSRFVERLTGVEVLSAPASSRLALAWLKAGKVHIAGTHLKDPRTGEFNVPIIRPDFPEADFAIVTFASWEEGFVTASGNPKRIKTIARVAGRGVRFVNRESGSGSRILLDALLHQAGIRAAEIAGYDSVAPGHLAAAYAVASGQADCCVATRSAARAFALDFIPVQSERYDFVLRRESLALPSVRNFLDALQRSGLRRKLELLAGYDTARTGAVIG